MELLPGGTLDHPDQLSDDVLVSMTGMQPKDGSVTIQLLSAKPIYPATMFFKPMTILVWIGTFTMGFSALLSAYYRRMRRVATANSEAVPQKQAKKAKGMAPGFQMPFSGK